MHTFFSRYYENLLLKILFDINIIMSLCQNTFTQFFLGIINAKISNKDIFFFYVYLSEKINPSHKVLFKKSNFYDYSAIFMMKYFASNKLLSLLLFLTNNENNKKQKKLHSFYHELIS